MPHTVPAAAELRDVIHDLSAWIEDDNAMLPTRSDARYARIAEAVRGAAYTLESIAAGRSVEVRVPPFVAVQCIAGPRHTRGTPPNVVQTDPHTWLRLVAGYVSWDEAQQLHKLTASGSRASEVAHWMPLVPLAGAPARKVR